MITRRQRLIVFVASMVVTILALFLAETNAGSRLAPYGRLLCIPIVVIVCVALGSRLAQLGYRRVAQPQPGERAIRLLTGSAVGEVAAALVLTIYPARRHATPQSLGLTSSGTTLAWLFAAVFTLAWLFASGWFKKGSNPSARRGSALWIGTLAAVVCAFCEEVIFRAFLIDDLSHLTASVAVQVFVSAAMFGLAHITRVDPRLKSGQNLLMLGWYGVVGTVYGTIYIMGGRSLLPVIASHACINAIFEPSALESRQVQEERGTA